MKGRPSMLSKWLPDARILIVDDEVANVDFLERLLDQAGYSNVLATTDSRRTQSLFTGFQPDLVLLDWLMPHLNGAQVLDLLRPEAEAQQYLPVLVLTADITRETRQQALSSGAKDFLTKPFDISEVLLRIRNLLETRYLHVQQRRQNEVLAAEIAERRRVEAALRSSEEKFRAIFRDALDVLLLVDSADGMIIDANPAAQAVLGYADGQLVGQLLDTLRLTPLRREAASPAEPLQAAQIERVLRAQGQLHQVCEARRANQTFCPVDLTAALVQWNQRDFLMLTLRDASERLRAEAEIRNALERERELSELRSRFVSMASHEFRTPLSTILSSAELLEYYGHKWTHEKQLEHVRRMQHAVGRMTHLLDEVLLIGRADAGRLPFQPEPIDLVAFCAELADECQLSAGPHYQVAFVNSGAGGDVPADARLLRQIITNLLSNAVKYSPDGGAIVLELRRADQTFSIQVRDQGMGIPADALPHLYEAFHRALNVEHLPGYGLGMAIVKRSVDLHGGTIECQSQLDLGTTFTVTLPLMPGARVDAENSHH